ncbi:hypothetical protein [Cylindrospermum sp. FACHB-282]|uniref:hypothetical protein n=1 Tax=Cylindrospermum sp. FACHB-282 TaxID=2692794 RepID=UPI0016870A23|nr:hypothetical protein [Cylindrospermum sp. FACHB-282]MBD2386929.1 hypothetical protein [Cylindrospermum sp. FACHB-282]
MPVTKTITVRRHQNLGDYSNKTLEETIQLNEGEDPEQERLNLQLKIERAIYEDVTNRVQKEISDLRAEKRALRDEISQCEEQLKECKALINEQKQVFTDIFSLLDKAESKGESIDDAPTLIIDLEEVYGEAITSDEELPDLETCSSDLMIQTHEDELY